MFFDEVLETGRHVIPGNGGLAKQVAVVALHRPADVRIHRLAGGAGTEALALPLGECFPFASFPAPFGSQATGAPDLVEMVVGMDLGGFIKKCEECGPRPALGKRD